MRTGTARSATRSSPSKTCVPTGTWTSASSPLGAVLARPATVHRPWPPRSACAAGATRDRAAPDRRARGSSPPFTAVTAVRPSLGDVLLAPERQPTVAASARLDVNLGAIAEHARSGAKWRGRRGYSASTTATERRSPLRRNSALPSRTAKIVSSLADLRARTRPEPRAALADDDLPGADVLAREDLDTEVLRIRVATVLRRAETLLMRHRRPPFLSADSSAEIAPFRDAFACS